jgi:hypothetical protein
MEKIEKSYEFRLMLSKTICSHDVIRIIKIMIKYGTRDSIKAAIIIATIIPKLSSIKFIKFEIRKKAKTAINNIS